MVLKGPSTIIADARRGVFRHDSKIPGLGASGTGDVLAGIIAGLAAQGVDALSACLWGVSLHARAARSLEKVVGKSGYLARELAAQLPRLMAG